MAQETAQQEAMLNQAKIEAEIQKLQAQSAGDVAAARERVSRTLSNTGLEIERSSEASQNRAIALKNKAEAIKTLLEASDLYGNAQVRKQEAKVEEFDREQVAAEDLEEVKTHSDFQEQLSDSQILEKFL
jgi:hypothetical protein